MEMEIEEFLEHTPADSLPEFAQMKKEFEENKKPAS